MKAEKLSPESEVVFTAFTATVLDVFFCVSSSCCPWFHSSVSVSARQVSVPFLYIMLYSVVVVFLFVCLFVCFWGGLLFYVAATAIFLVLTRGSSCVSE